MLILDCPPLLDKHFGQVAIYSGRIQNKECTFSIILNQQNLTISAYFLNPIPIYSYDLKVITTITIIISVEYLSYLIKIFFQVYDGPNVFSPLLYNFSNENSNLPPAFSTGPSLTMTFKDKRVLFGASLDFSYTSSDQGGFFIDQNKSHIYFSPYFISI